MREQLDLFPDTLLTPEKRADERVANYMAMWKAERRTATLAYLRRAIDDRLTLEREGIA